MTEQLIIMPPKKSRDFTAITELAITTFYHGTGHYTPEYWRENYFTHSHYDWKASRIGLIGDRLVTHFGVWDYQMRVGSKGLLRVAGIGAVATDNDFRKRNLMQATASNCVDNLAGYGYDVSLLFGIPNFYHRFGYVPAWPIPTFVVQTEHLPTELPSLPTRPFAGCSRPDLDALYNAENAGCTGTAVRPTYRHSAKYSRFPGMRWVDAQGKTSGYIIYYHEGESLKVYDSAGDVEQRLRVLGQLARKLQCKEVRIGSIPPDCALAKRLRWMTCRKEIQYSHAGNAMIHTLNLASSLTKLSEELSRRLTASPMSGWRGHLSITDPRETVTLALADGTVRMAPSTSTAHSVRGGEQIVQLLVGTTSPSEVSEMGGFELTGEAANLLEVLFPAQHATLAVWDSF